MPIADRTIVLIRKPASAVSVCAGCCHTWALPLDEMNEPRKEGSAKTLKKIKPKVTWHPLLS